MCTQPVPAVGCEGEGVWGGCVSGVWYKEGLLSHHYGGYKAGLEGGGWSHTP